MAVSVLEKVTIIARKKEIDNVLKFIQSLQYIELMNPTTSELGKSFTDYHTTEDIHLDEVNTLLGEVQRATQFIEEHSKKVKKSQTKRPARSTVEFYDLESGFDAKEVRRVIREIGKLRQAYNSADSEQAVVVQKEIQGKREELHTLHYAEEVLSNKIQLEEAKKAVLVGENVLYIKGYIATEDKVDFQTRLEKKFPNKNVYCEFEAIEKNEEDVPTKLKNNSFVAPFELLTEMYSVPKYHDLDPTPWLTPFYLVFFGMMVADIGYGALMLIATAVVLKTVTLAPGMHRFMKFFHLVSYPTIIWGIIYGTVFGVELPFYLLSLTQNITEILILSVVFGFIQILTGLAINGGSHIRRGDVLGAINHGLSWIFILCGIGLAVVGNIVLNNPTVQTAGTALAILGVAMVILLPVVKTKKISGIGTGLFDLYGITSYVGDMISYTRLMALGVAGASIATAFNTLVGEIPLIPRILIGTFILLALHGLNVGLSLLGGYVHSARLQYVEFFGKFYDGGGRAFKPLKPSEKYFNYKK